jgi:hypothetical protein
MIHSDVWTAKTESIGGCKYYMNFIDDHTRKVWVYFMKHKGEVFQHFLARFELCSWSGESIHANTTKATFECSEAHIEVHKTYLAMWNFL